MKFYSLLTMTFCSLLYCYGFDVIEDIDINESDLNTPQKEEIISEKKGKETVPPVTIVGTISTFKKNIQTKLKLTDKNGDEFNFIFNKQTQPIKEQLLPFEGKKVKIVCIKHTTMRKENLRLKKLLSITPVEPEQKKQNNKANKAVRLAITGLIIKDTSKNRPKYFILENLDEKYELKFLFNVKIHKNKLETFVQKKVKIIGSAKIIKTDEKQVLNFTKVESMEGVN